MSSLSALHHHLVQQIFVNAALLNLSFVHSLVALALAILKAQHFHLQMGYFPNKFKSAPHKSHLKKLGMFAPQFDSFRFLILQYFDLAGECWRILKQFICISSISLLTSY